MRLGYIATVSFPAYSNGTQNEARLATRLYISTVKG